MHRYTSYKNTNVSIAQEIPEHWKLTKIREIFEERTEKVSDKDFEPLSVTKKGILKQLSTVAKTINGDNRKKVLVDDFVINSRSDRKGSSGLSQFEGSVSLINTVLKIRNGYPKYLHYLLKSVPFQEEFYRNGKGIVADLWTTNYKLMKNIFLPEPPLEEQEQIAKYLDWKINDIERLIHTQKENIYNLEKLFQSFIDSKYEIGESVDESKKSIKLKYLVEHITTRTKHAKKYVALEHIISKKGILNIPFNNLETSNNGTFAEKGMVIFGKLRPYLAKVFLLEDEAVCSQQFLVLKPTRVTSEFLKYLMLSTKFIDTVDSSSKGAIMPLANSNFILNIKVFVPDIDKQKEITQSIINFETKINKAIEIYTAKVKLLEQLKQSLIAEVVTGQIDVRNITIPEYVKFTTTESVEKLEENDME